MDVYTAAAEPLHTATLWEQFAAPLRSFVARRAPREVDTEDVLQDVFVRIQAQLPNLRDADRIDAWIFQIARNVVADAFRKRARRELLTERAAFEESLQGTEDDERLAESALISCLASMIAQLPEPYRQAIALTEIDGVTQTEAARRVGLSISGMKSRVQRGREQLKGIIQDCCHVKIDARGRVVECDPRRQSVCGQRLRPSLESNDSMIMKNENESKTPETQASNPSGASGCCGGAAPTSSDACCALDAEVKATGGSGCGCNSKATSSAKKGCC